MKLAQLTMELCHHEAGHWVVAKTLGFEVGSIALTLHKDGGGIGTSGSSTAFLRLEAGTVQAIENYLVRRIAVLFAGVVAQVIAMEVKDENTACRLLESNGADDNKIIQELLIILRGIRFPEGSVDEDLEKINVLQSECWGLTNKIVDERKCEIIELSRKMAEKMTKTNMPMEFKKTELMAWLSDVRSIY